MGIVTKNGTPELTIRTKKSVLKSKFLRYLAMWILENVVNSIFKLAILIANPKSGLPSILAIWFLVANMNRYIKHEIVKLDQKATVVQLFKSSSLLNSCWTRKL